MSSLVLDCVLVADSGVAAVRVLRGLQRLDVKAVGVHTDADATALHARVADEAVLLGEAYDDVTVLVEAARQSGARGVHPGARVVDGLREAVLDAGLTWLGDPLTVPVALSVEEGVTRAVVGPETTLPVLPPRCAEVVTGLDLTCAALVGAATGVARDGVAVSLDVLATTLAPVTAWDVPDLPDVWVDPAVEAGTTPQTPLLAVVTAWGPDRGAALARARDAVTALVVEGPTLQGEPRA